MRAALLLLVGCGATEPAPFVTLSEVHMGTRIDLTLRADAADRADAAFDAFREVEDVANEWRPDSPLGRVNAHPGEWVEAPEALRALLRRGLEVGDLTGGAFDVTWAALWGLWDFERGVVPSADAVAERVARIDRAAVQIDDGAGTVRVAREGVVIGLGGIAKGWALDEASGRLRAAGVEDFALSAGGQVVAAGLRDGRPWRVGLRDPRGSPETSFGWVDATDLSVSTSGDYEHFFERDGVRYHHILDPRTGWPALGVRSATVVCAEATLADALSTALVVLGVEGGIALAEGLPGVEAVMVDDRGTVHRTSTAAVTLTAPPRR